MCALFGSKTPFVRLIELGEKCVGKAYCTMVNTCLLTAGLAKVIQAVDRNRQNHQPHTAGLVSDY